MTQVIDRFGCYNNTIKVSQGHYVDLANPDPSSIEIKSIASALSKICRFGGHSPKFYSVAEHCVHATHLARQECCVIREKWAVFLHDAAEAYIGDMVKPLKLMIPDFVEVEQRIEAAIQQAFRIDFSVFSGVIKRFDRAMLKAEKIAMWPDDKTQWFGFSDIEETSVDLQFWCPEEAERQFLLMARRLGIPGAD